MRSLRTAALVVVAALLPSCSSTPTSVLLTIRGASGLPLPDSVVLSIFGDAGVAVADRVLFEGASAELPADVVLYPPREERSLRLLGRALFEGATVGEGAAEIALEEGKQVSGEVVLAPGLLPDRDRDGIPDAVDNCPDLPNPEQGPCGGADAGPDGPAADASDGPPPDRGVDLPEDAREDVVEDGQPDVLSPDVLSPDVLSPDTLPPDLLAPDTGVIYQAVTEGQIQNAFQGETVPCVDRFGVDQGTMMPIVDNSKVDFFDGSVTLNGSPADTVAWVGGLASVTVVFDPNACDLEDPVGSDNVWANAGLLIRGATLDAQNRLQLAPNTTVADMNMLDVNPAGEFELPPDFAKPDDSELSLHPQLVNTINAVKQLILDTAQ